MPRHAGTNNDLLAMALIGYEAQKAKIDAAIREIQAQLGQRGPGRPKATADGAAPAKRTLSVAARRKIAAAQNNFWFGAEVEESGGPWAAPKKRKLSAAGRRAIIAATKKRWAAVRKAAVQKAAAAGA